MICRHCSAAADGKYPELHEKCLGDTWCDCQHKTGEGHIERTPTQNNRDNMKRKEE